MAELERLEEHRARIEDWLHACFQDLSLIHISLETVASAVRRATDAARKRWPGLPVLCSGGVASNRLLRTVMSDAAFAGPQYLSLIHI